MSTTAEVYEAEVPQYEQDCRLLKGVLLRLVSEISKAEAEAADTKWADEQADTLSRVLSDAQFSATLSGRWIISPTNYAWVT